MIGYFSTQSPVPSTESSGTTQQWYRLDKPEIRDGQKRDEADKPVTDAHKEHVKKAKAEDAKPTKLPKED